MLVESSKRQNSPLSYYFCWLSVIVSFIVLTVVWLRLITVAGGMESLSLQVALPIITSSFVILIILAGFFLGFTEASIFAILSALISFFTFLIGRSPSFLLNLLLFAGILFILHQERGKERKKRSQEIIDFERVREDYNTLKSEQEKKNFLALALKKRYEKFFQLGKIAEILSYTIKLEEIVNVVAAKSLELIGKGEKVKLFLTKEGQEDLILHIEGELKSKELHLKTKQGLKKDDMFDRWVVQKRQGLLITDVKNDFRFQMESAETEENSIISYPFLRGNETLGLLRLSSLKIEAFSVEDLRFLSILADLAAASLENARLYQKTETLATIDGLTGLYVRGYFEELLIKSLKIAGAEDQALSLLMVDIDRFKDYNDTYGHIVGDAVLKKIAFFLRQKIGSKGKVFRFGGEEFTVILPDIEKPEAIDIAEDIQLSLAREIIYVRRKETKITVSIGVAVFPRDGKTREGLIKKVDDALLRAKREGRNKVCAA